MFPGALTGVGVGAVDPVRPGGLEEKLKHFSRADPPQVEDRNPHPERIRGDCRTRTVRPAPWSAVFAP
jgi:hypothetical protein